MKFHPLLLAVAAAFLSAASIRNLGVSMRFHSAQLAAGVDLYTEIKT